MVNSIQRTRISTAIQLSLPLFFMSLASEVAYAQPGAQSADPGDLEEVIVTALRRAEGTAVMDTALAVKAMTGTELESRGFVSVMDAISSTPGVSVSRTIANGDAIQIRGVSAIIGDGVVGYYLDDLPYTRISTNESPDLNPYDLNRVEILRGPQGTLFGAGSQGGTVRILTQDPIMNEFSGKFTGGFYHTDDTDSDLYKIQGAINIPIVDDTLALRLVGSYRDEDGYIDMPLINEDNYNEMEQENYRAKLLWTPNEQWSVLGTYWYWEHETFSVFGDDNYEFTPTYTDLVTGGSIPAPASSVFADSENNLYGLTIRYSGESFSFTSSTSYFDNPVEEGLPVVGFQNDSDFVTQETFAQEFKFASNYDGSWNWTAGAIYLDLENEERGLFIGFSEFLPEPAVLDDSSTKYTSESWAVFGESIHELNEQWELTVGLRYYYDEREVTTFDANREPLFPIFGIENPNDDDWDQVTGRINLAWRPDDNSLYYANIAQGFRAGGLNSQTGVLDGALVGIDLELSVDPDEVISYELGAKWGLLDGNLNLEAVVYFLDWEDIQTLVTFFGPTGEAAGGAINAEGAEIPGVEFAATYQADGLTLSASANWNDAEYDGTTPGAGFVDGDPVENVPELTWSASASYIWPMGGLQGVAFLSATYTDERTSYDPVVGVPFVTDDTTLVAGRLGIEEERWSVFLTGENLTDEDGAVSSLALLANFGVPPYRVRPRTFGIEFNYNF